MIEEVVKIVNPKQASMYIKHGVNPIKVYWGFDRVVYEFSKEDTAELFNKWCKYELN
jgi:hypothetical protein